MILHWNSSGSDTTFSWNQDGETVATVQWARKARPFTLEWIGPDNIQITALSDDSGQRSIAAIIGPAGSQGIQGIPGPPGSNIPDALDGGNF